MNHWTPIDIVNLKLLWAEGRSAAKIAAVLSGGKFSRNAIIGKAHRLGLERRTPPPAFGPAIYRRKPKKLKIENDASKAYGNKPTMDALEPWQCRWPIGDPKLPGFHFCGAKRPGERPYCEHHNEVAYIGLTRRAV